ncbi:MAG: hypothetical protein DRI89_14450 [Bacteroidetes bacterium]|nr:MAG: hypothetical protein DRI89_14450 [Bacteroidota bacterium]
MKLNLTEKETCPRCGAKFDCGKSGKCWCFEVDVPPSVLEKIDAEYSSCLCPDCLNELSSSKADLPI